jgi:hypothetical protein
VAHKKSATLQELQSLIGTLNFACKVIAPGRAFLKRIINLIRGVSKPHNHIRLTNGFREDVKMWQFFLKDWNGTSLFLIYYYYLTTLSGKILQTFISIRMPPGPLVLGEFFAPSGFRVNGCLTKHLPQKISALIGKSSMLLW